MPGKKLKLIYLETVLVIVFYTVFSKTVFVHSIAFSNLLISFLGPFAFGAVSGLIFLYLFSHEDFFPIARQIEKEEAKTEKKWLRRFRHHSKLFVCLAVGVIGGPIIGALTVHFLIHRHSFWYKYFILTISTIISTFLTVGLARGLIKIF